MLPLEKRGGCMQISREIRYYNVTALHFKIYYERPREIQLKTFNKRFFSGVEEKCDRCMQIPREFLY